MLFLQQYLQRKHTLINNNKIIIIIHYVDSELGTIVIKKYVK